MAKKKIDENLNPEDEQPEDGSEMEENEAEEKANAAQVAAENEAPTELFAPGKVTLRNVVDEMEESYLDYAMSVIVSRALPDVRDGMKPVHRRILYAMQEIGLRSSAGFRKSAAVVGEVLAKYHPHGDSAVYDSMVRMAQDFSLRYPLIRGQGNFGSIDGDNAAAMRYTEAKMEKISDEMMADIDKETVDFVPTTMVVMKSHVCSPLASLNSFSMEPWVLPWVWPPIFLLTT